VDENLQTDRNATESVMFPDGTDRPSVPPSRPAFREQPLPTAGSVLWRPAVQELSRPDTDPCFIFVAPRVIAAVEDQLRSGPGQGLVGFLVGRVLTNPDTGFLYLVLDRAMPVPQLSVDGANDRLPTQSLAAVQRTVQPEDGELVGWYRTQPSGEPRISVADHEAHLRSFQHPWHVALVVAGGRDRLKGGLFRPVGDPGSPVPYLPFFELPEAPGNLSASSPSVVSWTNYWSPNPPPRSGAASSHSPARVDSTLGRRTTPANRILMVGPYADDQDEEEHSYQRRRPRRDEPDRAWRWWVAAAGIVVVATVTVEEWWLHRPEPGDVPAAPAAVEAKPVASAAPADPVRRAIEAYRLRATLFANHQMTCADLAPGLADVDDAWLQYVGGGAAASTPHANLATEVEGVEADFERTGCPRP